MYEDNHKDTVKQSEINDHVQKITQELSFEQRENS